MTGWTDQARAAAALARQASGQARIAQIARQHGISGGPFKVQQLDTKLAGPPWRTLKSFTRRSVAETVAQHMRRDALKGSFGSLTRVKVR